MDRLKNIIKKYPNIKRTALRMISLIPYSYRLGKDFWTWYSFFEESEKWDTAKIKEFQLHRLRELLVELGKTSKFYRARLGFMDINKIYSIDDFFDKVPVLSKLEFKNFYDDIISTDCKNHELQKSQTSGTTGSALQFYHSKRDWMREWAAICHQWKRVGYHPGISRRAEFRGVNKQNNLVEHYPQNNFLRCSILHLKKEHIIYYAEQISKNRIDFFHGYPSAFYLLSSEIIVNNIRFPQPKAILLASEMVYNWQLDRIQEAFPESKLFAHYGCAERTVLAGWCEHRREYHVLPQYGIFEIDKDSSEIIGTNFYNTINGFVRYRMTDTVLKAKSEICPDCRRPYTPRLIELSGRTEDFLYSMDKGWIPPAIVTYPLKALKEVKEIQFIQNERCRIIVRYSTLSQDNSLLFQDLNQIKTGLQQLFGKTMNFEFEKVLGFERGETGKFKWIINRLDDKP